MLSASLRGEYAQEWVGGKVGSKLLAQKRDSFTESTENGAHWQGSSQPLQDTKQTAHEMKQKYSNKKKTHRGRPVCARGTLSVVSVIAKGLFPWQKERVTECRNPTLRYLFKL